MNDLRLTRIYLADHHASLISCIELARRCAGNNPSGALAETLANIIQHLETEKRGLEDTMERVKTRPDPVKDVLAWSGEKLGRLKLNGRLTGYSDLSRLEELEGIETLMAFHLAGLRSLDDALEGVDVDTSIAATEALIAELRPHHLEAAHRALAP